MTTSLPPASTSAIGVGAQRLITDPSTREVIGVTVLQNGEERHVAARRGVVIVHRWFRRQCRHESAVP